ncbi:hypothetical protein E4U37_000778 [Claviceps purpurea]|nr:hypothetical protein E4U37_000778 [Claviceps purpurea]
MPQSSLNRQQPSSPATTAPSTMSHCTTLQASDVLANPKRPDILYHSVAGRSFRRVFEDSLISGRFGFAVKVMKNVDRPKQPLHVTVPAQVYPLAAATATRNDCTRCHGSFVRHLGRPSFFITFTANPNRSEQKILENRQQTDR